MRWQQYLAIGAVVIAVLAGSLIWLGQRSASSATSAAALASVPPEIAQAIQRLDPEAREAYTFALERPDVLSAVPCYCGCMSVGHTSNLACFVKRTPDGKSALDNHGST